MSVLNGIDKTRAPSVKLLVILIYIVFFHLLIVSSYDIPVYCTHT